MINFLSSKPDYTAKFLVVFHTTRSCEEFSMTEMYKLSDYISSFVVDMKWRVHSVPRVVLTFKISNLDKIYIFRILIPFF